MREKLIDGLMERIEYYLSACEKNGSLSRQQQEDFDAENYVLDSINQINKFTK